jgi:TRAP-type mannitol/chloroaromatic compound transport system permease small subunit
MRGWLSWADRSLSWAERIDALNRLAARLARWALLLMLALGTWNVVGRYVGLAVGRNLSSNALIEGQWHLFDLMVLLALGYALQTDDHVRVDVLQSRWSRRRQGRVELAATLGLLLPFVLVVLITSVAPTLRPWAFCCWACRGWPRPSGCCTAGHRPATTTAGRAEGWKSKLWAG